MGYYAFWIAVVGYLLLCALNGWISRHKRILHYSRHFGFWTVFYASILTTPILVFAVLLFIPNLPEDDEDDEDEEPLPDAPPAPEQKSDASAQENRSA